MSTNAPPSYIAELAQQDRLAAQDALYSAAVGALAKSSNVAAVALAHGVDAAELTIRAAFADTVALTEDLIARLLEAGYEVCVPDDVVSCAN